MTTGYLKYAMSAAVMHKYRFEESKALYLAETGINVEALPVLPKITGAVRVITNGVEFMDMGTYSDVYCSTYTDKMGQTIFLAKGKGTSYFNNTMGKQVSITREANLQMIPESFAHFMYFTESEEPGGGPGLGSYVSFGQSDYLEGKIHTNGQMQMSNWGCPDFTKAKVSAVEGIAYNNCNPDEWISANDEAEEIKFPPNNALDRAIQNATFVFTADDLLFQSSGRDTLIMTEIEFVDNGFMISQWTYQVPPIGNAGPPPTTFNWDLDTSPGLLNDRRIAFDASWDEATGFYFTDSLFIDNNDVEGNDITSVLDEYEVGDTVSVFSTDPDSNKFWMGEILAINVNTGGAIFTMGPIFQSFDNQFVDDEEVILNYVTFQDNSIDFPNFANYHSHPDDGWSLCDTSGFHHFDFEPPPGGPDIMAPTLYYAGDQTVIYVRNGQVRVKGFVDGQYTIVTDKNTYYRRSDDFTIWDRVWNNIWIIDDLIYEDSNTSTGEVVYGTPNRMGLFSGANIILANTEANGARNSENGVDLIVNAAMLSMEGSVVVQYWQNTISSSAYNGPNSAVPQVSLGDGRGPRRNPTSFLPTYTGNSDLRGYFRFWGSMSQKKRGYMKRNAPGPYNISPGIGYDKDYHYDYNFTDFSIPPYFPPASRADGSMALVIIAYGEISTNSKKGTIE